MKKKLLILGGVLGALAVVAFFTLQFFLGSIVKTAVNNFAPKITGTKVTLDAASISPLSGAGTLTGLSVGNPAGWAAEKAFYLGQVHVDVAPFSILGDHIVVNEIVIEQPEFTYETKIVASNIGDLLKNIETVTGSKDKAAQPTAKNGQPVKFEVKKFTLRNGKVTLGVGPAALSMPLPPLELTDLGTKEGGITPDQLVFAVMKNVTGSIVTASTKAIGQAGATAGAAAADAAKKGVDAVKGLFDKKK
jgi:uncharacterized protein involved in outer membrane biogenesis